MSVPVRDSELTLINFILRCPEIYKENEKTLKKYPFTYDYAKDILSIISTPIKKQGEAPTLTEALMLAEAWVTRKHQGRAFTSVQASKLMEDIKYCYSLSSTGASGDLLERYTFSQGAKDLATKVLTSSPEDFKSCYAELKAKLDELSQVGGHEEDLGISLMSPEGIEACLDLMDLYNSQKVIPTGFPAYDEKLLGGYRAGEGSMIMAGTGGAKTSLAMNIAFHNAICFGHRVVYLSMDNSIEDMGQRYYARWLDERISAYFDKMNFKMRLNSKIQPGQEHNLILKTWLPQRHTALDVGKFFRKIKERLYDFDHKNGVPEELCGHVDLGIIDYLEKLKASSAQESEMYRLQLFQSADELVTVGKEFKMPVIVLSQASKEVLKSDLGRTWMSGESYAKQHPMSHVGILCQGDDDRASVPQRLKFVCEKNRRPETSYIVNFFFDKWTQKIWENPADPIIPLNQIMNVSVDLSDKTPFLPSNEYDLKNKQDAQDAWNSKQIPVQIKWTKPIDKPVVLGHTSDGTVLACDNETGEVVPGQVESEPDKGLPFDL